MRWNILVFYLIILLIIADFCCLICYQLIPWLIFRIESLPKTSCDGVYTSAVMFIVEGMTNKADERILSQGLLSTLCYSF